TIPGFPRYLIYGSMTTPHPFRIVYVLVLISVATARAGVGPGCVAPPLVVPTPEPPRAESAAALPAQPSFGTMQPPDPPTPVVVLRVRVPASVAAGQELEYRICVENCSPAAAHHVLV